MDLFTLENAAANCTWCSLFKGRVNPVFAKGNSRSKTIICGMVPADEENKVGLPFVGRAGRLLDNILVDTGQTLEDVYITNLVKCYLAAGLPLKQDWVDACLPYLIVQIGLIRPKVIITLGKDSSSTLLTIDPKVSLKEIRKQRVYDYFPGIKVIPTYHPSYLLRGGGRENRSYKNVLEDFELAKEIALDK